MISTAPIVDASLCVGVVILMMTAVTVVMKKPACAHLSTDRAQSQSSAAITTNVFPVDGVVITIMTVVTGAMKKIAVSGVILVYFSNSVFLVAECA